MFRQSIPRETTCPALVYVVPLKPLVVLRAHPFPSSSPLYVRLGGDEPKPFSRPRCWPSPSIITCRRRRRRRGSYCFRQCSADFPLELVVLR